MPVGQHRRGSGARPRAARPPPSGGRRRGSRPPPRPRRPRCARTPTRRPPTAPRRRPRRWTPRGCAGSRSSSSSSAGTPGSCHLVASRHAPPVLACRGGGARRHDVLRRGRSAAAAVRGRLRAVEDRRRGAGGRLSGGHLRRRGAGRLDRRSLGRQAHAAARAGAAGRLEPGLRVRPHHRPPRRRPLRAGRGRGVHVGGRDGLAGVGLPAGASRGDDRGGALGRHRRRAAGPGAGRGGQRAQPRGRVQRGGGPGRRSGGLGLDAARRRPRRGRRAARAGHRPAAATGARRLLAVHPARRCTPA